MNTFSARLKKAMTDADMTQKQLSDETGLGKSSISQYLSGKNEPKGKTMILISNALDVPVEWLSGAIDEPSDDRQYLKKLPVEVAAKLMGVGKQMVRQGLKNGTLPFGYAVLMPSGKYRYYISPKKFTECTGIEIKKGIEENEKI